MPNKPVKRSAGDDLLNTIKDMFTKTALGGPIGFHASKGGQAIDATIQDSPGFKQSPMGRLTEGTERFESVLANTQEAVIKKVQGKDLGFSYPEQLANSFLGTDKKTYTESLKNVGVSNTAAVIGGLAESLFLDPVVLGGTTHAMLSGIKQIKNINTLKKLKSNEGFKMLWDAAIGKGQLSDLPDEVATAVRQSIGETKFNNFRTGNIARYTQDLVETIPDNLGKQSLLNNMHNALMGDTDAIATLPKHGQAIVRLGRSMIDRLSRQVSDRLKAVIAENPERMQKLAERMGVSIEGKKLDPQTLVSTIESNLGHYLKRSYYMFQDKKWMPNPEIVEKAVAGLQKDFAYTPEKAQSVVDSILANRGGTFNLGKVRYQVNQGSFIGRQDIPSYLRDVMGEIKDPRITIANTVRNLSDIEGAFKTFESMKKLGVLAETPSGKLVHRIEGGPLSRGVADGMYTTKEVSDFLGGVDKVIDTLDKATVQLFSNIKFAKTVLNPKTHVHNFMGNFAFSEYHGSAAYRRPKLAKTVFDVLGTINSGKPNSMAKELMQNNIIGTEAASSDFIAWTKALIADPYVQKPMSLLKEFGKNPVKTTAKISTKLYSFEDQFFKAAAYIYDRNVRKMTPSQAMANVYKWFPNYEEASKLAQVARTHPVGIIAANPFLTFRSEAHRIGLNAMKDPVNRWKWGLMNTSRLTWNAGVLGAKGLALSQIVEYMLARPEAVSDIYLNPTNPAFDLNVQYVDPHNTRGLFAPLLALAGGTGVNPFDYLLDFTNYSPDFGHSNLFSDFATPLLTGKDKYGNELPFPKNVLESIKMAGPTSLTSDLPKILDSETDNEERQRRFLRFFGIDVEKRNPEWIRREVAKRLDQTIEKGKDPNDLLTALETMGFDRDSMLDKSLTRIEKKQNKELKKKEKQIANEGQI